MKLEIFAIPALAAATFCFLSGPAVIARAVSGTSLQEHSILLDGRLEGVSHRLHESMAAVTVTSDQYLEYLNAQEATVLPEFVDSVGTTPAHQRTAEKMAKNN